MSEVLNEKIRNIYFLGIGGIGMSALARYFKANGYRVAGYDRTPSVLTEKMKQEEGMEVNYADEESAIGEAFLDPDTTLVIYTPAIPQGNNQMLCFRRCGFRLYKRAEVLGMLSRRGKALCIAGTHGKTTVSTLTAFLLCHSKVGCTAFLGGISMNFGTNLLLNPQSPYIVIEADEFDRSFLHLSPEVAVITAMDADHLDVYGDRESVVEAFEQFAERVEPESGKLFLRKGLALRRTPVAGTYAAGEAADYYADRLRTEEGDSVFDYHHREFGTIADLKMGIPGRIYVENAVAAITVALSVGVMPEEIRKVLPEFRGVARRLNIHVKQADCMYIDDYAHHPREIEATLKSIREIWPEKRLTVVFQPHLYTRTRDFYPGFAESLSLADEVLLLDIYPARELPIAGITSEVIRERLTVPGQVLSKEDLLRWVEKEFTGGLLMTIGAGDIDRLIAEITRILQTKTNREC